MTPVDISPDVLKILVDSGLPAAEPAIVTWNRLEGRPRRVEFDRSLRAEVRDPMWMLCRQWQFGEFAGEDAGSAVKAKLQVATARINRYQARSGVGAAYDASLPLETRVEHEPLSLELSLDTAPGKKPLALNLMTRAQMGRHWIRLLSTAGAAGHGPAYLLKYGFEDPDDGSQAQDLLESDPAAWATLEGLKGRVIDGYRLLSALPTEEYETWLVTTAADPVVEERLLSLGAEFKSWFRQIYNQPESADNEAWVHDNLEYQFMCSAPADELLGGQQTVLVAEQYHQGHLDWYSFDVAADAGIKIGGPGTSPDAVIVEAPLSFIPGPIEFSGMPNARWWEFEDRKTDLGDINASTTDLATLMLAEFALVYGNDWSLVPYDMDVGTIANVLGVVVTDVFGVHTLVQRAEDEPVPGQQTWGMYCLTVGKDGPENLDCRLLLPPTTPALLESPPLDRVMLTRDEMANMVWAIEDIVPGLVRGGVRGFEAASDLKRHFLINIGQEIEGNADDTIDTDALIRYQLGTTVSENWIPFVPEQLPKTKQEIQLRRAVMPRIAAGAPPDQFAQPRSAILRVGLPDEAYYINEVEAPQAGAIITRSFQRTRWWDGEVYTWLGRRKQTGRGQGSSGLEFDRIVPKESSS
jgi:hypothetical protein